MAFFSVIIPLYNKENFIEKTMQSILNQTFQDFEIIVVNDGSTDGSLLALSKINSEKIRIIKHSKNKGLSAARNTGIQNANTNYIAFLDADDLWKSSYLEKIFSLIKNFPEAKLFATSYQEIYNNNISITPALNLKNFNNDGIVLDFFESNLSQPIYCCCSLCVEKSVFQTIGLYDENITFGEDIDFNIRANLSYKLAYSTMPLVEYIIFSENQITNSNLKNKTIPNFNSYESIARNNSALKKYLDFNRYVFAKMYKMENDLKNFNNIKKGINPNSRISGLNYKQSFLLKMPLFLLQIIKKTKLQFLKKGIRFTSYN
jgi:glycosyltransferase involved in cell wall biosynthesis